METNRTEPDLFDLAASERAKQHGMEIAADQEPDAMSLARKLAVEICQQRGTVTADDVGKLLWERHRIKSLGPASGSIFKCSTFRPTGKFRKSSRKSNHARLLYEWELTR